MHLAVGMGLPARAHKQRSAVPLVSTIMAAGTRCPGPTEQVCPAPWREGDTSQKEMGLSRFQQDCTGAGWVHFPGMASVVPRSGIVLSKGTFSEDPESLQDA